MQTAYVLVSPCKDEARYIQKTLRSVARQTVRPVQWVIVDDGSHDDSMAIVAQYQSEMPFIKVIHRDTGARAVGARRHPGLQRRPRRRRRPPRLHLQVRRRPRAARALLRAHARPGWRPDPRLGTFSGKPWYHNRAGALVPELCGDESSVGMIKFYRRDRLRRHRWLRRRERLGHVRRPPGALARLARGLPRRGGHPLPPPPRHGVEPEGACATAAPATARRSGGSARTRCSSPPPRSTGSRSRRSFSARCGSPWATSRPRSCGTPRLGDADFTRFLRRYQLRALRTGKREAAEWAFRERARDLAGTGGSPTPREGPT